jgi:hypothetical protein
VAKKEIAVKKDVAKLRGARAARSSHSRWQEFGANADESANPAEGRRFGGGRRLERQRNLRVGLPRLSGGHAVPVEESVETRLPRTEALRGRMGS